MTQDNEAQKPSPAAETAEGRKNDILKSRAQALAKETGKEDTGQTYLRILEFNLGLERYGMEMKHVREVCPLKDLTPLPGTPDFVLGLSNIRGQILSVVDLRPFFNIPRQGLGDMDKIIIVQNERLEFGILADGIAGTGRVGLNGLQRSLPTVSGIGAKYLLGITRERLVVLDTGKILNDPKIVVDQT